MKECHLWRTYRSATGPKLYLFLLWKKELLYATERELEIFQTWFDVSKLSLKIKKTKLKVFGNWKVSDGDIDFNKNLGVVIDHKITWKQHTLYGKQSFKSRNIWKYNIMPTDHSFFPRYFTVSTFKITIYAKVLLLAIHIDHTNPLFINPHPMKFNDLVDYKII